VVSLKIHLEPTGERSGCRRTPAYPDVRQLGKVTRSSTDTVALAPQERYEIWPYDHRNLQSRTKLLSSEKQKPVDHHATWGRPMDVLKEDDINKRLPDLYRKHRAGFRLGQTRHRFREATARNGTKVKHIA
jgi:hypothetical protein